MVLTPLNKDVSAILSNSGDLPSLVGNKSKILESVFSIDVLYKILIEMYFRLSVEMKF